MDWLRGRAWFGGAATLAVTLWLAGIWAVDALSIRLSPVRIAGALALAMAAGYFGARSRGRGPAVFLVSVLLAMAGVCVLAQVGAQAYGAWRPLPPGPPAWVVPLSGLMALLAMLALSAAALRASPGAVDPQH